MIVELFGPPAAGKSTFVRELVAELERRGVKVEPLLSNRPAELSPSRVKSGAVGLLGLSSAFARVVRPLRDIARQLHEAGAIGLGEAREIVRRLPPHQLHWRIRLTQYLMRLQRRWEKATRDNHVVIFDQAWIQAACSLALLGGPADRGVLRRLLIAMPKSDLAILVSAPADVISQRLGERARLQGRLERALEFDLATNLRSAPIIDQLVAELSGLGRLPLEARSGDTIALSKVADAIEVEIRFRPMSSKAQEAMQVGGAKP